MPTAPTQPRRRETACAAAQQPKPPNLTKQNVVRQRQRGGHAFTSQRIKDGQAEFAEETKAGDALLKKVTKGEALDRCPTFSSASFQRAKTGQRREDGKYPQRLLPDVDRRYG